MEPQLDPQLDIQQWIETWRGPLVALHAGMGAPWGDARELAQDTLVEGYLSRDRLRGDATDSAVAGPWLSGIARNLHRAWRRERGGLQLVSQFDEDELPAASTEEVDPRGEALRAAMERLPEKLRTPLYMRYLEETPQRDIAALLGVPEKTVEGRLHRARALLRERLASHAEE